MTTPAVLRRARDERGDAPEAVSAPSAPDRGRSALPFAGMRALTAALGRAIRRPSILIPTVVVLLALGAVLVAALAGLRVFQVISPSMAQTIPVGSAVLTQPRSEYRVGEIVTFHQHGEIYTHRLSGTVAGGFTTRGDLNAVNDPWVVAPSDIVGAVVVHAAGVGWLLQALPWVLVGLAVITALSCLPFMPKGWRWAIRIGGGSLLFGVIAFWLRPWVSVDLLGYTPSVHGGVLMRVVNTGLFDVDAHGTVLSSGESAVVHLTHKGPHGRYALTPTAAMSLGQKVAAAVMALAPLVLSVAVGYRPASRHSGPATATRVLSRTGIVALAALVVGMLVVGQVLSFASLTASVKNGTDKAGARTWFTCTNALTKTSGLTGSWAMNNTHTSGTTETDLSGNGDSGTYTATPSFSSGSPQGCKRDTSSSVVYNGSSQCMNTATTIGFKATPTQAFTIEAWFKTSSSTAAKIIGMSSSTAVGASNGEYYYDRHIYIDPNGRLVFGAYNGSYSTISSPAGTDYSDGAWHFAAATLSSAGSFLYVDGALVDSDSSLTYGTSRDGMWKVGCGTISGWPDGDGNGINAPASYFTGNIQFAAAFSRALSATEIREQYLAGAS